MSVTFGQAVRLTRTDYGFIAPVADEDNLVSRRVANALEPGVDNVFYQDPTGFTVVFTGADNQAILQARQDLAPAINSPDPYTRAYGEAAFQRVKLDAAAEAINLDVTDVVKNPEQYPIDGAGNPFASLSPAGAPQPLLPGATPMGTAPLQSSPPAAELPSLTQQPAASPTQSTNTADVPAPASMQYQVEPPPPPSFEQPETPTES